MHINKYRNEINYNNTRNLLWALCNKLSLEYSDKAVSLFNSIKYEKEFLDKINCIITVQRLFYSSCRCNYILIEIAKKDEKYDVYESLVCSDILAHLNIELLYYSVYTYNEPNYNDLESTLNTKEIEEYINKFNISISKLESIYKSKAHNFIIPVIEKNETWKILKNVLIRKGYK